MSVTCGNARSQFDAVMREEVPWFQREVRKIICSVSNMELCSHASVETVIQKRCYDGCDSIYLFLTLVSMKILSCVALTDTLVHIKGYQSAGVGLRSTPQWSNQIR